jgi:hypothetical protein
MTLIGRNYLASQRRQNVITLPLSADAVIAAACLGNWQWAGVFLIRSDTGFWDISGESGLNSFMAALENA